MDSKLLERIRKYSNGFESARMNSKLLERPISGPTESFNTFNNLCCSETATTLSMDTLWRIVRHGVAVRTELFGGYQAPNVAQSGEALKKLTRQKREDFLLGQQYPGVLGPPRYAIIQRSSVTMGTRIKGRRPGRQSSCVCAQLLLRA
jgi:hypothetical protein